MRNDMPGGDPKEIWKNQSNEVPAMTLKLIQWKARELRMKTRKKLLGSVAGPVVVAFFWAYSTKLKGITPLAQALFAFIFVWSLLGTYILVKGLRSGPMPGDAALSTGLEFCRREIERQQVLARRILLWSFLPSLLGIAGFVLALALIGAKVIPRGVPFLVLVGAWVVAYFVIRSREDHQLQTEMDQLRQIEAENRPGPA